MYVSHAQICIWELVAAINPGTFNNSDIRIFKCTTGLNMTYAFKTSVDTTTTIAPRDSVFQRAGYLSLSIVTITTCTMIAIFIHLYIHTRDRGRRQKSKSIRIAYAAISFYIFYGLNIIILSIYNIATNEETFSPYICLFTVPHPLYFTVAKILMFLFYLIRLYNIFQGTSDAFSKRKFQIFGVIIIIGFSIPPLSLHSR
eukprot:306609_1